MHREIRVAEYNQYKDSGGPGAWKDGILEINLGLWDKFHEITSKLLEHGDFIWRGQRHDWPLKSKFGSNSKV